MKGTYMLSIFYPLPCFFLTEYLFFFLRVPQVPRALLAHLGFQENQELMFSWDPLDRLERMELLVNLGPR